MSTTANKKQKVKTQIIGLKDLRVNMDKYIKAVDEGQSFTVVRRSKPIFAVTPLDEWGDELNGWETFDFKDSKGNGIPAKKFLKLLREYGSGK